jgi:hypothetical protein
MNRTSAVLPRIIAEIGARRRIEQAARLGVELHTNLQRGETDVRPPSHSLATHGPEIGTQERQATPAVAIAAMSPPPSVIASPI